MTSIAERHFLVAQLRQSIVTLDELSEVGIKRTAHCLPFGGDCAADDGPARTQPESPETKGFGQLALRVAGRRFQSFVNLETAFFREAFVESGAVADRPSVWHIGSDMGWAVTDGATTC